MFPDSLSKPLPKSTNILLVYLLATVQNVSSKSYNLYYQSYETEINFCLEIIIKISGGWEKKYYEGTCNIFYNLLLIIIILYLFDTYLFYVNITWILKKK